MVRCDSCRGQKRIVALGNISTDCPYCHGIGYIDSPELATEKIDISKVKRGRKKKSNDPILHVN